MGIAFSVLVKCVLRRARMWSGCGRKACIRTNNNDYHRVTVVSPCTKGHSCADLNQVKAVYVLDEKLALF